MAMATQTLPGQEPTINVKCDDYLVIPAMKAMTRVTIGWTQDRSAKDAVFEIIPRSADDYRGYGYNISAADKPEVLVFIAVELLDECYKDRAPLHLGATGNEAHYSTTVNAVKVKSRAKADGKSKV
jgi:hypothetical protein